MIFQDFPGPGIFKKKIQDFPGGMGTLYNGTPRDPHWDSVVQSSG